MHMSDETVYMIIIRHLYWKTMQKYLVKFVNFFFAVLHIILFVFYCIQDKKNESLFLWSVFAGLYLSEVLS